MEKKVRLLDGIFKNKKSSTVRWNFQKYLIDPSGKLINYWYSITNPLSQKITKYF